jgi:hypothetical protein
MSAAPEHTLADSSFGHLVNAPIERVDIADWLLHLTSAEYRRCCPPAHIACGTTTTDAGEPMSITVETIADNLLIEQYIGEIVAARHCRMVSTADVFSPLGRTTSHVVWDLSVEPLDERTCEYVNHVVVSATAEFLELIDAHGVPFEEAAASRREASEAHNELETWLFAESIERRALGPGGAERRS